MKFIIKTSSAIFFLQISDWEYISNKKRPLLGGLIYLKSTIYTFSTCI